MLYLHIGLHKTATSSLQKHVFPNLQGVYFLGRWDGGDTGHKLYQKLCMYCFSANIDNALEGDLVKEIVSLIDKKGAVLISEEWFTADYSGFYGLKGSSWQVKLDKLSRIVKGIEHKILVTIREPVSALFSQYCEFNKIGVQKIYKDFTQYCEFSNDAEVFHYKSFDAYLRGLFTHVQYLPFDLIVQNQAALFLCSFFNVGSVRPLLHENYRNKSEVQVEVVVNNKYVRAIFSLMPRLLVTYMKSFSIFVALHDRLHAHTDKIINIPSLQRSELLMFQEKFKASRQFYAYLSSKGSRNDKVFIN